MMSRLLSVSFAVLLVVSCQNPKPVLKTTIAESPPDRVRRFAKARADAFVSENYARLADLTYPKFYEMFGGRDKEIGSLRSDREYLKTHGGVKVGAEVGEFKRVISAGNKQFAIVPVIVRIEVPEGVLRSQIFFIAISEDSGKTWTFINSSALHDAAPGKERETLTRLIPGFPPQLSLPLWKPRVLEQPKHHLTNR
jgi:hypothetical protein